MRSMRSMEIVHVVIVVVVVVVDRPVVTERGVPRDAVVRRGEERRGRNVDRLVSSRRQSAREVRGRCRPRCA